MLRLTIGLLMATGGLAACDGSSPFSAEPTTISVVSVPTLTAIGATVQLTARVFDQRGEALAAVTPTWTSSEPSVATVSASGLATAVANGTSVITAQAGRSSATLTLTVQQVATVLSPASVFIRSLGDTARVRVMARDARGNVVAATPEWTSLNPEIATITVDGLATAVDNGNARVRVRIAGLDTAAVVFVDQQIASFTISPSDADLSEGDSVQFSATVLDARGVVVRHRPVVWGTADSSVATVSSSGWFRATGRRLDSTRVVASAGGLTRTAPAFVSETFIQVVANHTLTCALTSKARRFCWGDDMNDGHLGVGYSSWSGTVVSPTPVSRLGEQPMRALSAGSDGGGYDFYRGACAISTAGTGHCWGSGPPGNGQAGPVSTPVTVVSDLGWLVISPTGDVKCGIVSNGTAWCWGHSYEGSLGNDDRLELDESTPVAVAGGRRYVALSTGGAHTCAIEEGGRPYCWGSRSRGAVGDSALPTPSYVPVPVSGGHTAQTIVAQGSRACLVTTGKALWCWGQGSQTAFGDGLAAMRQVPVEVTLGTAVESVTLGTSHACALATDGRALCWGINASGQLGDGTRTTRLLPVAVLSDLRFRSLAAGGAHTCGIALDDGLYCWGSNTRGELGNKGPTGADGMGENTPVLVRGSRRRVIP